MAISELPEPIKVGTFVKILNSGFARAKVVEDRGLLGPRGTRIYRVMYRGKPYPGYVEVREDQLEILGPK